MKIHAGILGQAVSQARTGTGFPGLRDSERSPDPKNIPHLTQGVLGSAAKLKDGDLNGAGISGFVAGVDVAGSS